jgi:DNA polymerase III sliding clamp (beta) subunit (PCNA family)
MNRIFNDDRLQSVSIIEPETDSDNSVENCEDNLTEALDDAIIASLQSKILSNKKDTKKNLQSEFQMYEKTGIITKNLKKLLDALKTIPPTSIESERAFSISSNFCTKKRSSLSDKSLNALTFLKYFFLMEDLKV